MTSPPTRMMLGSVALMAGATLPLAFAPFGYYPLAIIALSVVFWVWSAAPTWVAAAFYGWLFGVGMFGVGVSWVQVSIHQFGLPLYSFSVTVTALFVLGMALYPALVGGLGRLFPIRRGVSRQLVMFPALWAAGEILRGWLFTGFPWLLLGYSQVDSPLGAWSPVVGSYGTGFVVALLAGALIDLITAKAGGRRVAVATVGLLLLGTTFLAFIRWTEPVGPPLSVALIQGAVPQEVKWRRDYRQPSIELYWRLSELHWGRTVVIWPETAIPAFPDEVAETLTRLDTVASERGSVVLVGMPTGSVDEGAYFNSVMAFGAVSGRYDKRRLVPFGEYLPFDRWLRQALDFLRIPMSNFSRGQTLQVPVEVAGHRVGISICYEDAYASEVRRALPDAAFLVNVSNDAWFGDSIAPHQHLEIARARALETGRFLLRATNTGISAVIDDRGSVVTRSAQFQPATVIAEFQPRRGATPYVTYGEAPVALILFTIFAVAYARRNRV